MEGIFILLKSLLSVIKGVGDFPSTAACSGVLSMAHCPFS